jgi:hypothetical protein
MLSIDDATTRQLLIPKRILSRAVSPTNADSKLTDRLPEARLLISPGCAHCPTVLAGLSEILKAGRLSRLEVINIADRPDIAKTEGVRSVPWFRIGPFELSGAMSVKELEQWVEKAAENTGTTTYYAHLLEANALDEVLGRIKSAPSTLNDLLRLLEDGETPMSTRIAVGAILENLEGTPILAGSIDLLGQLSTSERPDLRADASHYLGLTHNREAMPWLEARLDDEDAEVCEIAAESLALIQTESAQPDSPTMAS